MFYKIGFFVLLAIVIACAWLFIRSNPMKNEGASSWVEFYSDAPAETIAFMRDTFGIESKKSMESAEGAEYNILQAKGQLWPFAGVMNLPEKIAKENNMKVVPHTIVYLTVKDYDAADKKMIANGSKAILKDVNAGGMRFGIYIIPGGFDIGIAQYGVK